MTRRIVSIIGGATALAVSVFMVLHLSNTSALTGADWQAGNIISDAIFTNASSMSAAQIQDFLDGQINAGGGCDVAGTRSASDWGRPDLTHAQFATTVKGWPGAPYVCLNKYYEVPKTTSGAGIPDNSYSHYNADTKTLLTVPGGVSAAQIIYNAAQQYQINPQVLLIKIQTESHGPLTQDTWPLQTQYTYALGANCPDSGPGHAANCDSNYAGFSMQVYTAASLMRSYMDNVTQPWWTHYKLGNNSILYNPDTNCGSSTVNVRSMATAALYTYTPYQPNNAVLNATNNTSASYPGGTVSCGAYGNRNFWWWFSHWFGSTTILAEINDRYDVLANAGQSLGGTIDNGYCVDAAHTTCWQGFQKGYIVYSKNTGAWESLGSIRLRWEQLRFQLGELGFPTGPIICGTIKDGGCYQGYQGGYIVGAGATGYWESLGDIRTRWFQLSYQDGALGYPTGGVFRLTNGGYYQQYQNGYIVGNSATGWWESMNGPIRDRWSALKFQDGRLGYPTAAQDCSQPNSGCKQRYQGGTVYWTSGTGAWQVWGEIGTRYAQLDANSGDLGYPVGTEVCGTIKGNGCYQQYQNGYIVGSSATGWWESLGAIRTKWSQLSFQDGRLGYATGAQDCGQPSNGCKQRYQDGTIYWTSATGAWQVWGAIGTRYNQVSANSGDLGYPLAAEVCGTIKNGGCYQQYQNGYIVGSGTTGYWESLGPIRSRWSALGFQDGKLGYALSPQLCSLKNSGCYQLYQGGYIVGTAGTGYWESSGPIRDKWASLGFEESVLGYPTGAINCAAGTCTQTYEHGTITSDNAGTRYSTTP